MECPSRSSLFLLSQIPIGTDFSKYKVVKKGQFTYIPDTSRRGDKIGIALLEDYEEGLVSNVYTVFEVIDSKELIPEYLMLWFSRPEFDRYARYKSHGSVREIFDWNELCMVELPVPEIEEQKKIVKAYQTITDRIALKKRINDNLEDLLTTTFKQMFVDDDSVIFSTKKLKDITMIIDNRGKTPPNDSVETPYPLIEIASLRQMVELQSIGIVLSMSQKKHTIIGSVAGILLKRTS